MSKENIRFMAAVVTAICSMVLLPVAGWGLVQIVGLKGDVRVLASNEVTDLSGRLSHLETVTDKVYEKRIEEIENRNRDFRLEFAGIRSRIIELEKALISKIERQKHERK